ncbi:aldehyde dehydrogenase [Rhodohalobacter halophilus]|uniref:aldehyde dehydrogenase n=1 Tax=Rhodohalobacter halophilus TaxID=1812810 RepID=UPI00083FCEAE|nr:aldehyde dehydrogenase [Rhodohalobacter halophilus]
MTIEELVQYQIKASQDQINRPVEKRKAALKNLRNLLTDNEEKICGSIAEDFGKPYIEAYLTEIATVVHEIDFHLKNLSRWAKPEQVRNSIFTFPSSGSVYREPFGTVLIIGAWNYPVHLLFMPLIGALSAGNNAVLKPSELAKNTSALVNDLIEKYFSKNLLAVVEGAVEETQQLLSLPFDKIFFTGSTRVGKIVMKAAAEQLIPVTLELGGKSPAIVHSDANMEVSAKRIWWGKTMNAGQICVAPDFVLIHESVKESFIEQGKIVLSEFYRNDYLTGQNYTQIINLDHFDRLIRLLDHSDVLFGGTSNRDNRFIEPTLIDADWDSDIMQEEIFGPLLPIVTYNSMDEVQHRLNSRPSPLALYLFTESREVEEMIIQNVSFGGGCINETISHLGNPGLPFGGVGLSGMGSYHGKRSFDAFSREKSILKKPTWPDPDFRYPPLDSNKLKWIKKLFIR